MYKKVSAYLLPVLLLAIVAFGAWGYQMRSDKQTVLIKAENQYQRAFHELNANVDQLHRELAKLQILTHEEAQRKGLANVWRLANLAQNDISQLPLAFLPFQETQQLLHNISDFAYQSTLRDTKQKPFSAKEKQLLQRLYKRTGEINQDLSKVQTAVIQKKLRWMDVELALAEPKAGPRDNMIIDGFKLVNQKVMAYHDLDWGPTSKAKHWAQDPQLIGKKPLSQTVLQKKAEAYAGGKATRQVKRKLLNERGVAEFVVRRSADNSKIHVQLNQYNGWPISFMDSRALGNAKWSAKQAVQAAENYLRKHGLPAMNMVAVDKYERAMSVTFVENMHNMLIYPHKMVLNVALDNGEIIGLQSDLPFAGTKSKAFASWKADKIPQQSARAFLAPAFKVRTVQLAVIENERGQEVLCYQFDGKLDHLYSRVFINAQTGAEERLEWLNEIEL